MSGRRRTPSAASATVELTTWYLEMRAPEQLGPARAPAIACRLERVHKPLPAFGRYLYTAVGGDWHWRDRLGWNWDDWIQRLADPRVELWVLYAAGAPAGYAELERQPPDDVEIRYFGLIPEFCGLGLGGHLLQRAVERAWALYPRRVWVHTCSWDGPQARANYEARGFQLYDTRVEQVPDPGAPIGPWPGARGARR